MKKKASLLLFLVYPILVFSQQDSAQIEEPVTDYFMSHEVIMDSCSSFLLYDELCNWIEVPYEYASDTREGTDCSGLVKRIYEKVYQLELSGSSSDLFLQSVPVEREFLEEGDLVFFKIRGETISHVGIYLRNNRFIHASTKLGVTISDLDERYYTTYFYSGGRLGIP